MNWGGVQPPTPPAIPTLFTAVPYGNSGSQRVNLPVLRCLL